MSDDMPGRKVDLPIPPELPETFGYRGAARYVAFRWSSLGDELIFDDGVSSGSAESWAFQAFRRHPAVAGLLEPFDLGSSEFEAEDALVIDRVASRASVAPVREVRAFLRAQWPPEPPLSAEQIEAVQKRLEALLAEHGEKLPDMQAVMRAMAEQRGRLARLISWLDQCPAAPQQGRGA